MSNANTTPLFDDAGATDAFATAMAAQGWKLKADNLSREEAMEEAERLKRSPNTEAHRSHSGATWRVWHRAANWDHPLSVVTATGG